MKVYKVPLQLEPQPEGGYTVTSPALHGLVTEGETVAEALATLKCRAEEALAADGVERTRLGYEVLVKLTVDDLLERDSLRMAVERESPDGAATAPRTD